MPQGFHLISVYLWTAEGLSERNKLLLHKVHLLTQSLRGPWVLGGDFNIDATVLQEAGWPRKLGGQLFAPTVPTCHDNVYDFFIVSLSLAGSVVGTQSVNDVGGRPHRPSRLLLAGGIQRQHIWKLVAPLPISSSLPPTAPMRPPSYSAVLAVRPKRGVRATHDWRMVRSSGN